MTDDACCEPGDCKSGRLRIGAVVLAAGEGARLGGRAKGLIEIDGEPLLLRALRVLSEVGVDEVVVVTGHYRSELSPLLALARPLFDDKQPIEVVQPVETSIEISTQLRRKVFIGLPESGWRFLLRRVWCHPSHCLLRTPRCESALEANNVRSGTCVADAASRF